MGVLSRKPDRVRRLAMPVTTSIEWKPLRDSYYVVASLQPGGGGRRQIFAQQSILREIQDLARGDAARPVVGLLLGERLDCAITLKPYVVIESHVEVTLASLDEPTVSDAIRTLRSRVGRQKPEVLGWFCRCNSADAVVSRTQAAVHAACFAERWHTVLTFGNGGNAGAFFLHDSSAARWFHAPFYEVTDPKASSRTHKPTSVAWPAYLTTASVVPLAETLQQVPVRPPPALVAAPISAPVSAPVLASPRPRSVAFSRPIVRARRTPARDAIVVVGRAAVAARRSALDLARTLGTRAVTASRLAAEGVVRIRAKWVAKAAQRKAEAHAAQVREDERRARQAAERRAANEEAQRRAAEAAKRRAAETEARRAAEAEARQRAAEAMERRRAAEAEASRQAAEAEARRRAEAAEAEAVRRAEAAEAQRAAEVEAQRRAAEAQRKAVEESQRRAAEAEAQRRAADEAQRKAAEEEQRRAAEAEARRLSEEAEAEAQRQAAIAEEDAQRNAAEAEALRISVEVAAIREKFAGEPIEGSRRTTPKTVVAQVADVEDSSASDGPYRYLALARREGFEVSEKIERGSSEQSETVWLLHEKESGLRLIVVTTDEAVREASLHYNLRTDDDSVLEMTAPEHRDLESRMIYGREACLQGLRARCRRLRATGALERDWKVLPSFLQAVSPR